MRTVVSGCVYLSAMGALCLAFSDDARVADAAMRRDSATLRSLLKQGADVNAAQGDGMTALHWAARLGDADVAQMLVYAGANVRATTRLGAYTPLFMASQAGHARVIDTLLKAGADPKATTTSGTTPLMAAAASGNADAVTRLLDRGSDVHAKESARGETALMFAAAYNRVDAMKVLIAAGADVKATTKVVDLKAQTNPEEEAFLQIQRGLRQGAPGRGGRAAGPPPDSAYVQAALGRGAAPVAEPAAPAAGRGGRESASAGAKPADVAGATRQFRFAELVTTQGGLTPVLFAARHGYTEAVTLLLDSGADVNQISTGDRTSPLLMATINGHFDLAKTLLDRGANPRLASDNGVTPLYAALNVQWAPKALYPQPRAYLQQKLTYLEFMKELLARGVDVNARLKKKVWYSGYNFDLSGVDEIGGTAFWRAAYASDVEAMRLLVANGADPNLSTTKPAGRPRTGDGGRETVEDVSGLPPVPVGGPAVPPLHAATGVGYGEGFAANSHRNAPSGWMPAVTYLIEELGADVNARDHEGNTALHHAAARGDNEMILYLVSKGADVKAVNRAGETTADMANGPVQRIQPFPETIALLEKLGAKNNNKCKSC
jgi:ankyrin repeat protein